MEGKSNKDYQKRIKELEDRINLLEEENSLYKSLMENIPNGIQVFDKEGTSYLVNNKQKEILGLPRLDEGIGKFNVLKEPITLRTGANKVYERVYKGEKYDHIFEYTPGIESNLKEGAENRRTLHENIRPVFNDKGEVIFVISLLSDITEEKLAEDRLKEKTEDYFSLYEEYRAQNKDLFKVNAKLQESNDLLSNLTAQVPGLVFEFRLHSDGSTSIPFSSPGMKEIYGFEPGELVNDASPIFDRIHPEDLGKVKEALNTSAENFNIFQQEFRVILPGKGVAWRRAIGQPEKSGDGSITWYGIVLDTTKEKQNSQRLKEQQILFETMFNTLTDAVVITDTHRKILLANKGVEITFGYDPGEVINKSARVLYSEEENFIETGKAVFNEKSLKADNIYLTNYRKKNGEVFPGEAFGAKLYNSAGEWIGNLAIVRNVSERQKYIDDLKNAMEKAKESDRLKTAFLQNMSHEIRTPMNGIIGFSQLYQDNNIASEKRNFYADIVIRSAKQLLSIVDDIITISSIETCQVEVELTDVELNTIIRDLYELFSPQAEKADLELHIKPTLPDEEAKIKSDASKLTQILSNLISNALKFTQKGFIEFGYDRKDGNIEFYVKDTGQGLPPEFHEKIFERFIQRETKSKKYSGTGLGLSISKGLVELLGGNIRVESEPGKGSVFYFTVPVSRKLTK
jgi:hypothetical protein